MDPRMSHLGIVWETSDEFQRWIDDVFELVRREVGGKPDQHGEFQYHAEGEFGFAGDATIGDVVFSIDRVPMRAETAQWFVLEWRSYQPSRVAEKLIDAYRIVLTSAR